MQLEEEKVTVNYNLYPHERYAICKECKWFRSSTKQCKKCYCVMPIKVLWKAAHCPIKKW